MIDLLRDPVWQFVGAVLAFAAIGVSVWVYFAQRPRKRVLVERIARVPLVAIGRDHIPGLEITVNGRPVESATVVVVRIANIGNAPIIKSDFDEPIVIRLEPEASIIDARITQTSPTDIPIQVSSSGGVVVCERHLLNPNDSFTCRILLQNSRGTFTASGRIVGVTQLDEARPISVGWTVSLLAGVSIVILGFIFTPKPMSGAEIRTEEIPYLVVILGGFTLIGVAAMATMWTTLKRLRDRVIRR